MRGDDLIRRAVATDAQALASVRRAAILVLAADVLGEQEARRWADRSAPDRVSTAIAEQDVWLNERTGVIAGWVQFHSDYVGGIYVHPNHAGRGLGARLLAWACDHIAASGQTHVRLHSSPNAEGFYIRQGLVVTGPAERGKGLPMERAIDARRV